MPVLVVDDNDDARASLEDALALMGYAVIAVGDGYRAIEYYERRHGEIDVAVVDLRLPELSGPDVVRALLRIDPELQVIITTGLRAEDADAMLLGLKPLAVLRKPFHVGELVGLVRGARQVRPGE